MLRKILISFFFLFIFLSLFMARHTDITHFLVQKLFTLEKVPPMAEIFENFPDKFTGEENREPKKTLTLLVWNLQKTIHMQARALPFSPLQYDIFLSQEDSQSYFEKNWSHTKFRIFCPGFKREDQKMGTAIYLQTFNTPLIKTKCYHSDSAEPFTGTPKTTLFLQFRGLTLINIHALNFVSFTQWKKQIESLSPLLKEKGPLLLAGDFNTWSLERIAFLKEFISKHQLSEILFKDDKRVRVFNHPIDYVFTKGLSLRSAETIVLDQYSDHNALEVVFQNEVAF